MKTFNLSALPGILLISILILSTSCVDDSDDIASEDSAQYYYDLSNANSNYLGMEGMPPGDQYEDYGENPFIATSENPVSTFSVDADGGSYANIRRFLLTDNLIPPPGAVRIEEIINYFELDYAQNNGSHPISLNGEIADCPWLSGNKLVRIGIKGESLPTLPASNFVFLIDVSGSMSSDDKLDMLKAGFVDYVDELSDQDRIAIVTYAGSAGVLLESTPGSEKQTIKDAINSLGAGGSTAGAEGIVTAYDIAAQNFIHDGNNRIIIGTDGDFNVGISDHDALIELIEEKRESGVFITVLGVGRGNLNDATLEQIANKGNGTYEYIDNLAQLQKVFVYEQSKFYTVAKDVKVQVEFNPLHVESYRLIGYENRVLSEEDFEDDQKDAGEIGANQNVTALYEIVPKNRMANGEDLVVDFRYKRPQASVSTAINLKLSDSGVSFSESSDHMQFVACNAAFGMLMVDSEYIGSATYDDILSWLDDINLPDEHNFKAEFRVLVEKAKSLDN